MAKVDLANQIADSLNKKWKDQKVAFFLDDDSDGAQPMYQVGFPLEQQC